jgi:hypothetical protein
MFGKISSELIDQFILEINKEENQEKLKCIVIDPTICYIIDKMYPYILITSVIFMLTFILTILILFTIIKSN